MTGVRLIAKTVPVVDGIDDAGGLVAYVARVSNPANQHNFDTAPRLLGYLRRHQHWSPFEMAHAVLEITTTRDIARQMLRHRSFSFQEFSQRYAEVAEFSAPRQARLQDATNRQGSIELPHDDPLLDEWHRVQRDVLEVAGHAYRVAIERGIAKEVARAVLPEGLTLSRLYMAGSLRSWLHYLELRTGNGTQREHRDVALSCQAILEREFPSIFGVQK